MDNMFDTQTTDEFGVPQYVKKVQEYCECDDDVRDPEDITDDEFMDGGHVEYVIGSVCNHCGKEIYIPECEIPEPNDYKLEDLY